jgi:pyruvate kinase
MLDAGMDVARLNFSHGEHEWHAAMIDRLRALEAARSQPIGILADLQGPRMRVGKLRGGAMTLFAGSTVTLTTEAVEGADGLIPSDYELLPADVHPGSRILLVDGLLELRVESVAAPHVVCTVVTGGVLADHKGMNLVGVEVSAPALSEKDRADLAFAVAHGVDFIALSFVRKPSDVEELRTALRDLGSDAQIVAKLEKPEALADLDGLLAVTDAVMVARGDLGVEMPPEQVPIAQKRIIARCMAFRKPVIVATQMLESMCTSPRPTRAEVADVANAVLDGADAVMLSEETAAGQYPVEAVRMMDAIVREAEGYQATLPHLATALADVSERLTFSDAVARAAAETAEKVGAGLIAAFTESGFTARLVSKCRSSVPAVAVTPNVATARRCTLYWGVTSALVDRQLDPLAMVSDVETLCLRGGLACGATIVITWEMPAGTSGATNMMRLHQIGSLS